MARYYKVWDIEEENNYAVVRMSKSRKVREDNARDKALVDAGVAKNGYITDFSDSFVRFVGKAFNQLQKYNIQSGDTIIAEIDINNEPYIDNNGQVAYPKGFRHTVYDFELPEQNGTPRNMDKAPTVAEDTVFAEEVDNEEDPF